MTPLANLDEPVRRYFEHAIGRAAPLPSGTKLEMRGRIKVARWLPFSAVQETDGRSFTWLARVGLGPLTLLRVEDGYADAAGHTDGRLLGHLKLFHADGPDTTRSAAGRAALESVIFAPPAVLPEHGVRWRAQGPDVIVASFDLPPERPEVTVRIDGSGGVRSVCAPRWGRAGGKRFAYVPCGGMVHAEQRFGDLVLPSRLTVGWWFGTPRYAPFFEARIVSASRRG